MTLGPINFHVKPGYSYDIPATSYTSDAKDSRGNDICNIYVIGQSFSDTPYWVIGESFLKHHYVTFDASSGNPKVGITLSTTTTPHTTTQGPNELAPSTHDWNWQPPGSGAVNLTAAAGLLTAMALAF